MSELGNTLREAREQKDISLDELQAITKIQKRYLIAVEKGEYHQLPGDFYTRAFIKSYAEAIGLDPDELFDTYQNELPTKRQDISKLPPRGARGQKSYQGKPSKFLMFLPRLIVIILLVGILVVIWSYFQGRSNGADKGTTDKGTNVQIKGKIPTKNQTKTATNKDKAKQSNSTSKGQTQQNKQGNAVTQTLKLDKTSGGITYYTLSNTKSFNLDISKTDPKASAWVKVQKDGPHGKTLFKGMIGNGKTIHFDATNMKIIYVWVGSSKTTVIKINGQDFKFPNKNTVQHLLFSYK